MPYKDKDIQESVNARRENAKDWAGDYTADIDSIRTTGKPADVGIPQNIWGHLKHAYHALPLTVSEMGDQAIKDHTNSLNFGADKGFSAGDARQAIIDAEKAQALRDYQSHTNNPTSAWSLLRGSGSYGPWDR